MIARFAEPDYQLVWPRTLFKEEASRLLNKRQLTDWNDRCEFLLEDAFVRGYAGGPAVDFRELEEPGYGYGSSAPRSAQALTRKQDFLRGLMTSAGELSEDPPPRVPYWRERMGGPHRPAHMSADALARQYVDLVRELEVSGYFARRFGTDCVDNPYDPSPAHLIEGEFGQPTTWPIDPELLAADRENIFQMIEVLHDLVARPQRRDLHSYNGCGWHHHEFDLGSGRAVYRWRVNSLLRRADVPYRLADDGADVGRLVGVTDDARAQLVQSLLARDTSEQDEQVRHAISLFRGREAGRHQKRSAVAALALVIEERRHGVLTEALAKSDRGALFDIANNFHIRHQGAKQKRDYDDFYLDWIFWLYLSTVELINCIVDEQRANTSPGIQASDP
ncbi:hypothetical protein I6A84_02320 [Frankia sp. CNm7]|uniref:Uncharacterized protein n=1 Tax=Frankia nepalensis TaxID=1836974 RepID=A0A937RNE8_9ACTN|nr:hypothetical protein [Frankia nepalensis]MBL7500968.1 hypothetical protein [Frankia nepalensis]MBL7512420.1 hypothetical protein [Frankia nepalensis]MBL7516993.1 hypothetical protein [Frankia nepalensis]MBL7631969.1 hypothetical protein [Frankia nepalensis]